jgi:hypothetical protein
MHGFLLALTIAIAPAASPATDQADVLATVHRFVDGFNKGDMKAASAACADQTNIIDEFAPFQWQGAGACAVWARDYDTDATKNHITDGIVTLGKARHVDISGNSAYVVMNTDYAFKRNGKREKETGSVITCTLQKGTAGWHITGWTWSKA